MRINCRDLACYIYSNRMHVSPHKDSFELRVRKCNRYNFFVCLEAGNSRTTKESIATKQTNK